VFFEFGAIPCGMAAGGIMGAGIPGFFDFEERLAELSRTTI